MRLAYLIPPMLLLAACGDQGRNTEKHETTEVSINADGTATKGDVLIVSKSRG